MFVGAFLFSTREIIHETPLEVIQQHVIKQSGGVYRIPDGPPPTVHLVVAATSTEDTSWLTELRVPGMETIIYIADNKSAPHHAQENKGHEAMMYHQYFYDYYDKLADISILIHSQKMAWHVEQLLDQSMLFSLNHMDMREIQRRRFLNLRVTWGVGCSSGQINTTKVNEESGSIPEQKEMQEAFRANFNIYDIPEILATPCCSQIAVVKELVRSRPREQYKHHIQWLLDTKLDDSISGRTWEHMWQYLFLKKAVDCPIEHRAYCRLYHICFGGREQYDEWIELQQGAQRLRDEIHKLDQKKRALDEKSRRNEDEEKRRQEEHKDSELDETEQRQEAARKKQEKARADVQAKADQKKRQWLEEELSTVDEAIRVRKEVAMVRGSVEANRIAEGEDIYGDALEPGLEFTSSLSATPMPTPDRSREA
ncbi:hypothetical protein BP5796_03433 [Coleophoma crateriformis]|uniref:Uncharacterized protein n=1 Tax=Coleophoma crateriformis TaxID=565419 RepID=A0A3D8SN28_9HELO|nr:hypothetical protein BP5796_03433 [Coleophoma crateriformis]